MSMDRLGYSLATSESGLVKCREGPQEQVLASERAREKAFSRARTVGFAPLCGFRRLKTQTANYLRYKYLRSVFATIFPQAYCYSDHSHYVFPEDVEASFAIAEGSAWHCEERRRYDRQLQDPYH